MLRTAGRWEVAPTFVLVGFGCPSCGSLLGPLFQEPPLWVRDVRFLPWELQAHPTGSFGLQFPVPAVLLSALPPQVLAQMPPPA